jgi:hypothetical protein
MTGWMDVVEMVIMTMKYEKKEAYAFTKALCDCFRSLRNVQYTGVWRNGLCACDRCTSVQLVENLRLGHWDGEISLWCKGNKTCFVRKDSNNCNSVGKIAFFGSCSYLVIFDFRKLWIWISESNRTSSLPSFTTLTLQFNHIQSGPSLTFHKGMVACMC